MESNWGQVFSWVTKSANIPQKKWGNIYQMFFWFDQKFPQYRVPKYTRNYVIGKQRRGNQGSRMWESCHGYQVQYRWAKFDSTRDPGEQFILKKRSSLLHLLILHYINFADTKIEDNSRGFKLQKANFDMEVNTAVSCCLLGHWRSLLP